MSRQKPKHTRHELEAAKHAIGVEHFSDLDPGERETWEELGAKGEHAGHLALTCLEAPGLYATLATGERPTEGLDFRVLVWVTEGGRPLVCEITGRYHAAVNGESRAELLARLGASARTHPTPS